jgi:DNA-binding MarR family transcriptional regulator
MPKGGHFAALEEPELLVDASAPSSDRCASGPPTINTSKVLALGSISPYNLVMSDTSLAAILRLLRAQSFVEARIDPGLGAVHGLALREFMFLVQLDQAPANRLRRVDLAARLNVSQSTVTRLALPLEKLGFVKREADPRDARVGYVVLTKAGCRRVAEARATLERSAAGIFRDRWSDKDIATLASLLGRFTVALPGDVT